MAEAVVVEEEEAALALLLRVDGVDGMVGSSVWNSGANSGPTLAPRELALVVTILDECLYRVNIFVGREIEIKKWLFLHDFLKQTTRWKVNNCPTK